MKSDIEIAGEAKLLDIEEIREKSDIPESEFSAFGRYKGKIFLNALNRLKLNVPTGWRLNVNDIEFARGAGYVIQIDIDDTGQYISGLF